MLTWMEHYLIDKDIKKPEKIRKKIENGKFALGIYLITFSSNPDNILEIFDANLLKIKAQREACPPIVGIAKSKENAIDMIIQLLNESMQTEYAADLISYIKNR